MGVRASQEPNEGQMSITQSSQQPNAAPNIQNIGYTTLS